MMRLFASVESAQLDSLPRVALLLALMALAPVPASATGFTDVEQPPSTEGVSLLLDGYFRTRAAAYYDLDLDRGPTPSGQTLFPLPLSDPQSHFLDGADMRLRTDITLVGPRGGFDIKVRIDAPDNMALGNAPIGSPAAANSYQPAIINVRRAYGEAYTPVGVLAAGRMGSQWGLGMLANGGDCLDCDGGDAADRIAFITPLAGHLWALAYDFTAVGVAGTDKTGLVPIDLDPTSAVRSLTFAFLRWHSDLSRTRRDLAGKTTVHYGAYVSYRWQSNDVPANYVPATVPVVINGSQVVPRDFGATATDGWLRIEHRDFRIELEGAGVFGEVGQTSLVPGVLVRGPVTMAQLGGALESEFARNSPFRGGVDVGAASGNPTPGFGALVQPGEATAKSGDIAGSPVSYPNHATINNFQFNTDYHVDLILFREIIGTVTDAWYVRPHLRWDAVKVGPGTLTFSLAAIASFAMIPESTPSGQAPLGIELDPAIHWGNTDGFSAALEYGVLFPLDGLNNTQLDLRAQPAQIGRVRLNYVF